MKKITAVFILFFIFLSTQSFSQDIENIKKADPLKITGGFNTKTTWYGAKGTYLRRDPFFWMLNANLNFNFYGVLDVPLSLNYTKQDTSFNYPSYQQFGLSPKYKAVTLHGGYRSIQLSQYTLSGVTFMGGGIEIKPANSMLEFTGLYGRFAKPIEYRTLSAFEDNPNLILQPPSYERIGYGSKVTIKKFNQSVDFIMFSARDLNNSIGEIPFETGISPAENTVLGLNTRNKITKKISMDAEFAMSAYTHDIRTDEVELTSYSYANHLGFLFTPRLSSTFNNAFTGNLKYQGEGHLFGIMYRRIDPEYKSMGSAYLNNDVKEFTFNASSALLKKKLNLTGNIGGQQNNLNNQLQSTMKRLIASVNATYTVNEQLNCALNFSNFSSNTLPTRIDLLDSIKYLQITNNMGIMSNYKMGDDKLSHDFSFTGNYQLANTMNQTVENLAENQSKVYNVNIAYNAGFKPQEIRLTSSFNYSNFTIDTITNLSIGPTFGFSKSYLENKIRFNINTTFISSYANKEKSNNIKNFMFGINYKINKHHVLRFDTRYLIRKGLDDVKIHQYQGGFSYRYVF